MANLSSILNVFPIKLDVANLANPDFPHPSNKTFINELKGAIFLIFLINTSGFLINRIT